MYAAYDKLSPHIKKMLSGPTAQNRRPVTTLRKEPVDRSQLYANPGFTTHIDVLTVPESQALLKFLEAHVDKGVDFQIRLHWKPNSVAIWDNRAVQHHAVWDS